ncbi:YciI family protein [Nocardiopsis sp. NPDC058631]|uniref:YciI family protein n=1 Tax=Nocardiopsis sp. NPDC058631 TaxID=3346566 RepID=UPI0036684B06
MKFALLYHYDPHTAGPVEEEVADWMTFDAQVREAGLLVDEAGFHVRDKALTVSVRDGESTVTEGAPTSGPMLAGYYLLDVADMAAALQWAARIPTAAYGSVEVRPIVDVEFEGGNDE